MPNTTDNKKTKIPQGTRRRVDKTMLRIDEIHKWAQSLEEETILDLFTRASIPAQPDGYPSSTSYNRVSGGSTSEDGISRSVESHFTKTHDDQGKRLRSPDPVLDQAKAIERAVAEAHRYMHSVLDLFSYINVVIEDKAEEKNNRQTSTPCAIEGCVLPAEKSGLCINDYNDWWKHGSPDRARWLMFKNKTRNNDTDEKNRPTPVLLVPECPPPSPGKEAIRGPHAPKK
jgi:hypothetical protein